MMDQARTLTRFFLIVSAVILLPGVSVCASPQTAQARSAAPFVPVHVEREWKGELFRAAPVDLLKDYRPGDVVVIGGRVEGGAMPRLAFFGQEGLLRAPVEGVKAGDGSLLRGRFRVALSGGSRKLRLLDALGEQGTVGLRRQAAGDYRLLLPLLARTSGQNPAILPPAVSPADLRVVPPPEGWQVLYVTFRRQEQGSELHVAFRYDRQGGNYSLTRAWVDQEPQTRHAG